MTQANLATGGIFGAHEVSDGEGLVFERAPYTDWVIELLPDQYNQPQTYTGSFRTTYCEGKECEQFTLYLEDIDITLAVIHIFGANRVVSYCYAPVSVEVNTRKKRITIQMLCIIEIDRQKRKVGFLPPPE